MILPANDDDDTDEIDRSTKAAKYGHGGFDGLTVNPSGHHQT